MLSVTPLPTYLGVWNKPRQEQLERVASISFNYLLVSTMCNAVWTSYAFKTKNIDLAIVTVTRKYSLFLPNFFSSDYRYCDHSNLSFSQARVEPDQTIFHGYSRFPDFQFWHGADHDVWNAWNYFQYNEFISFPDLHARSDKNSWCLNNQPANERHELPKLLHLDPSGHLD